MIVGFCCYLSIFLSSGSTRHSRLILYTSYPVIGYQLTFHDSFEFIIQYDCVCVHVHAPMCVFVIRTTDWMTSLISSGLLSTLFYLLLSICPDRLTCMDWKRGPWFWLMTGTWQWGPPAGKRREYWWWVWYLFFHFFFSAVGDYLGMLHALLKVSIHIRQLSLRGLLCLQYHPPYLPIIPLSNFPHVPFRFRGKKLSCC